MTGKFANIVETIGNTPVVRIEKLGPEGVNLFVKLEAFNPMGSVKDRLAIGVIEDAEKKGLIKPGQTVVEATSGNTGIGLAMVCAQRGYPLVVVMAENFSVERRKLMRFLGARVVLTPASEKGIGMLAKAVELAETHGWFLPRQFENEANADIHSRTTAPEILGAFDGERLDYWVTGAGTGGTLKGVARVLKKERPEVQVVVCEPDNSQVLGSGLAQQRDAIGAPAMSHPLFRPHLMQGWSPDFIPNLVEDAVAQKLIDRILPIAGDDALAMSRQLACKEGIFTGITGGATFAGALQLANEAEPGAQILCMLPDTGERYLSTPLFEDIPADMSAEEIDISRSTPRFRFDASAPPPPPGDDSAEPAKLPEPTAAAVAFVEETVTDAREPVVMFSLEWCEFCWSVRRMFAHYAIPYRSIALDSVEYQRDNWGGDIRNALRERTGMATIPQIFVGGEFLGGCTETFDAFNDGRLTPLLEKGGVPMNEAERRNAYTFLPSWLHPRQKASAA